MISEHRISEKIEKEKVKVKVLHIRHFEKRSRIFKDNCMFKNSPKNFYRQYGKNTIMFEEAPTAQEILEFGNKIWADEKEDIEKSSERKSQRIR